jgi:hypothetical protein
MQIKVVYVGSAFGFPVRITHRRYKYISIYARNIYSYALPVNCSEVSNAGLIRGMPAQGHFWRTK